jgi:hypothetical protein
MDATTMIVLAIVVVLAIAAVAYWQFDRSRRLRTKYGTEYERAVDETGGRRKAEAELHAREKRVHKLDIRPLSSADRSRYVEAWRRVQADFVDNPEASISHADRLLGDIMQARGYPVSDVEQRAADLSVDHPEVVEHYRTAHDIARAHEHGRAGTEGLRQAMIHYRQLFDELVGDTPPRDDRGAPEEERHVRH